jgi:3-methyladenine DNA glycosylase AlkD
VLALFIWVRRFERDEASLKKTIYGLYLENRAHINNWDLVDVSAPHIVGTWLLNQPRAKLHTLARSKILWDRRVAMVATFAFIRAGQFDDTLALARRFLHDSHDLMHKATGWMLREVGKRDEAILKQFLDQQVAAMPSIMLSYATEKFPPAVRRHYQQRRRLG